MLATKLQILELDTARVGVAQIESRLLSVGDYELVYIARVLKVELADLFPRIVSKKRIQDAMSQLMQRRKKN